MLTRTYVIIAVLVIIAARSGLPTLKWVSRHWLGSPETALDTARVQAVGMLLDRGWGKAPQPHTGEDDRDVRVTISTAIRIDIGVRPSTVGASRRTAPPMAASLPIGECLAPRDFLSLTSVAAVVGSAFQLATSV